MVDHEDIRAAADYSAYIHRRDAKAEYERWGLSVQAVEELIEKGYLKPAVLIDRTRNDSLTESSMQLELSPSTFREVCTTGASSITHRRDAAHDWRGGNLATQ